MLAFTTGALDLAAFAGHRTSSDRLRVPIGGRLTMPHRNRRYSIATARTFPRPTDLQPSTGVADGRTITFRSAAAHLAAIQAADPAAASTNWAPTASATRYGTDWIDRVVAQAQGPPKRFIGISGHPTGSLVRDRHRRQRREPAPLRPHRDTRNHSDLCRAGADPFRPRVLGSPHVDRPLQRLLLGVRHATDGNLHTTLPVVYKDEVGVLTESFNMMTANFRDLTGRGWSKRWRCARTN